MMKLYAVVDREAKSIVATFTSLNDASATRSFLMLLTDNHSLYATFPEQFDLYSVCDIDYKSGVVVSAPGNEDLIKNGFKVDTFVVTDAIKYGSDYDKRYLSLVRDERASLYNCSSSGVKEIEVSSDV